MDQDLGSSESDTDIECGRAYKPTLWLESSDTDTEYENNNRSILQSRELNLPYDIGRTLFECNCLNFNYSILQNTPEPSGNDFTCKYKNCVICNNMRCCMCTSLIIASSVLSSGDLAVICNPDLKEHGYGSGVVCLALIMQCQKTCVDNDRAMLYSSLKNACCKRNDRNE